MKKLYSLMLLMLPLIAWSQSDPVYIGRASSTSRVDESKKPYFPKIIRDTLYLSSDLKFWQDQHLRLGYGSDPNKNYNYISTSPVAWTVFAGGVSGSRKLGKENYGRDLIVKKIKRQGDKRHGYRYFLIVGVGNGQIENYWCDIQGAIDAKEVIIPGHVSEEKPVSTNFITADSPAERLTKLAQLLKDSLITREEFDKQKAKILDH